MNAKKLYAKFHLHLTTTGYFVWLFQPCLEGKNIQGISETSSTGIAVKTTF